MGRCKACTSTCSSAFIPVYSIRCVPPAVSLMELLPCHPCARAIGTRIITLMKVLAYGHMSSRMEVMMFSGQLGWPWDSFDSDGLPCFCFSLSLVCEIVHSDLCSSKRVLVWRFFSLASIRCTTNMLLYRQTLGKIGKGRARCVIDRRPGLFYFRRRS